MPDRYRVKRYKTSLTIPIGTNTVTSAAIPDVAINGLLRGVIVTMAAVDTALDNVNDTISSTENVKLITTGLANVADTVSHTESIGVLRN